MEQLAAGRTPIRANRRPRKLLRNAFTAFSLLFIAGYVASGWYSVCYIYEGGVAGLFAQGGAIRIVKVSGSTGFLVPDGWNLTSWWSLWGNWGSHFLWKFDWHSNPSYLFCSIPLWPVVLALIIANCCWYWRNAAKRLRPGCCTQCGYDLRATPERCPECGHAAADGRTTSIS